MKSLHQRKTDLLFNRLESRKRSSLKGPTKTHETSSIHTLSRSYVQTLTLNVRLLESPSSERAISVEFTRISVFTTVLQVSEDLQRCCGVSQILQLFYSFRKKLANLQPSMSEFQIRRLVGLASELLRDRTSRVAGLVHFT